MYLDPIVNRLLRDTSRAFFFFSFTCKTCYLPSPVIFLCSSPPFSTLCSIGEEDLVGFHTKAYLGEEEVAREVRLRRHENREMITVITISFCCCCFHIFSLCASVVFEHGKKKKKKKTEFNYGMLAKRL